MASGVELANVKMSMNPFDEIAVEEVMRLKEGAGHRDRGRFGRAGEIARRRSARRCRWVPIAACCRDAGRTAVEPLTVAKLLKAAVEAEQPKFIILGKQAIDDDCNQTGQMLAALLGWPQGTSRPSS